MISGASTVARESRWLWRRYQGYLTRDEETELKRSDETRQSGGVAVTIATVVWKAQCYHSIALLSDHPAQSDIGNTEGSRGEEGG
jgi:hypothetical protein